MWQDVPDALDAQNPAAASAAIDNLELEPTRRVGDDEGLGDGGSTELARPASEATAQAALGCAVRPSEYGGARTGRAERAARVAGRSDRAGGTDAGPGGW
jgi:hypothetical protein